MDPAKMPKMLRRLAARNQTERQAGITSSASITSVKDALHDVETALNDIERALNDYEQFKHQLIANHKKAEQLDTLRTLLGSLDVASMSEDEECRYHCYLARVHEWLGSYEQAHHHYRQAVPQIFRQDVQSNADLKLPSLHVPGDWFRDGSGHTLMAVLHNYLSFLVETQFDLELAEEVLDTLPWLSASKGIAAMTDSARPRFLLLKIRLLNAQRKWWKALLLLGLDS